MNLLPGIRILSNLFLVFLFHIPPYYPIFAGTNITDMKDAFYYLYILIFAGFLLSSAPTCHAEKADFDIKKAKFSQTMEYETDSAKEAAVQKEVKQGTDAELYKLYNYIFNNDAPTSKNDYEDFCKLLEMKHSKYMGYLQLHRIQLWLYLQTDSIPKDSIAAYCELAKQVTMEHETPPDTFMHTWALLIMTYVNNQYDNEAFMEAQEMLQAAKEINFEEGLIFGNEIIGKIFSKQKLWKLSAQYYKEVLSLIHQAYRHKTGRTMIAQEDYTYYNYGDFMLAYLLSSLRCGNYETVKENLEVAEKISKDRKEQDNTFLYLKGLLHAKTGDEPEFRKSAAEYRRKLEEKGLLEKPDLSVITAKDVYHYYEIMVEYYLYHQDYAKAQEYCREMERLHPATELKARIMNGAKKYAEAAHIYKQLYVETDSLRQEMGNNSVGQFAAFMENETLQLKYTRAQMETQKAELERNRIVTLALIIIILAGIAFLYRNNKLMKKLRLSQAELQERNDILAKKEKETIAALQRAEEANRIKTSFLMNITHEIRTPLNIIVGFAQMLHASGEEEKIMLEEIQTHSNKLAQLIDTTIELADYDTASNELEMTEANLHICCMISVEQVRQHLQPGVSLKFLPSKEITTFRTNETAFTRLLNCLLYNASKFTTQGEVSLSYRKEGEQIRIEIQDTGKGIPAQQAEWIFERFTKIDEFVPGFGLGLPLARAIAHRLGGDVELDTKYTNGARFIITLPL